MAATDIILILFQLVLAAAALQDLWRLQIANLFPITLIALYGGWLTIVGIEPDIWQNALLFTLVLVGGTALFARGWLGGGDVKLLAATALWFDLAGGLALLAYVTIGGGALGLAFILLRRLIPAGIRDGSGWAGLKTRGPIPYGLAIAAGAILCLHLRGVNPAPFDALTELISARPF